MQQLLPKVDSAKFVTEEQKEKFQQADWRVRVPVQHHDDLLLPAEMMAYACGDVQFLAPVFVALANRSIFPKLVSVFALFYAIFCFVLCNMKHLLFYHPYTRRIQLSFTPFASG